MRKIAKISFIEWIGIIICISTIYFLSSRIHSGELVNTSVMVTIIILGLSINLFGMILRFKKTGKK